MNKLFMRLKNNKSVIIGAEAVEPPRAPTRPQGPANVNSFSLFTTLHFRWISTLFPPLRHFHFLFNDFFPRFC